MTKCRAPLLFILLSLTFCSQTSSANPISGWEVCELMTKGFSNHTYSGGPGEGCVFNVDGAEGESLQIAVSPKLTPDTYESMLQMYKAMYTEKPPYGDEPPPSKPLALCDGGFEIINPGRGGDEKPQRFGYFTCDGNIFDISATGAKAIAHYEELANATIKYRATRD